MNSANSDMRILASAEVVACKLEGGKALLDLQSSNYFKLNTTAALLWEWISEEATVNSLVARMLEEFDVEEEVVRADVEAIIASFADAGLIAIEPVGNRAAS